MAFDFFFSSSQFSYFIWCWLTQEEKTNSRVFFSDEEFTRSRSVCAVCSESFCGFLTFLFFHSIYIFFTTFPRLVPLSLSIAVRFAVQRFKRRFELFFYVFQVFSQKSQRDPEKRVQSEPEIYSRRFHYTRFDTHNKSKLHKRLSTLFFFLQHNWIERCCSAAFKLTWLELFQLPAICHGSFARSCH